jgi:hypothetical protein
MSVSAVLIIRIALFKFNKTSIVHVSRLVSSEIEIGSYVVVLLASSKGDRGRPLNADKVVVTDQCHNS